MKYKIIRIKTLEEENEKYSVYHELADNQGKGNTVVQGKFDVIAQVIRYLKEQ
jgi:hypothetical protein